MARNGDAVTAADKDQLLDYISSGTEQALESNSRSDMREWLEEISDLTDPDAELIFNEDGTVEIAADDADEQDDEDDQ